MNSMKFIVYITIFTTSYNTFGMLGLHHPMSETEVQTTLQHLSNENSSYHKTDDKRFPKLSEKEEKEKANFIKFGLECIPPKNQDQYFREITNRYLNKNLTKSDPIPRLTKKKFDKQNLLVRRHSQ